MRRSSGRRAVPTALVAVWMSLAAAGCVSLQPVESTPEGIIDAVAPGDRVRLMTRDLGELVMQVRTITDTGLLGRIEHRHRGLDTHDDARGEGFREPHRHPGELDRVRFDRIETIELERLSVKKAMLTTFVPAIIAAVVLCNNTDCETRSAVTTSY